MIGQSHEGQSPFCATLPYPQTDHMLGPFKGLVKFPLSHVVSFTSSDSERGNSWHLYFFDSSF